MIVKDLFPAGIPALTFHDYHFPQSSPTLKTLDQTESNKILLKNSSTSRLTIRLPSKLEEPQAKQAEVLSRGLVCFSSLDLKYTELLNEFALALLLSCHNLSSLCLSSTNLQNTHLSILAGAKPNLTTLDLSENTKLTKDALRAALVALPRLTALNLSKIPQIHGLFLASQNLPSHLEELSLNECSDIQDIDIQILTLSCRKLQVIHLDSSSITDITLSSLSQKNIPLLELSIRNCLITEQGLNLIIKQGHLQVLHLQRPYRHLSQPNTLSPSSLSLKTLSLTYDTFPKELALELYQQCPELEVLLLPRCSLNEETVYALFNFRNSLVILDLSFCDVMTEELTFTLLQNLPKLRSLGISGCRKIPLNSSLKFLYKPGFFLIY